MHSRTYTSHGGEAANGKQTYLQRMLQTGAHNYVRWMQSRTLDNINTNPSSIAVYRDPYHSLRMAEQLFESNPKLASCVRRILFDGYYSAETNAMILNILRRCNNIDYLTVPWTTLRYGDEEDWSRLLGQNKDGRNISSLELLAVDLKQSQIDNAANQVDKTPLVSSKVDFSGLKRLKIFGDSNFMPVTDKDLVAISHTAVNLCELHITGTSSVTIDGIGALANSSEATLEILEHSPLSADGFAHPDPTPLLSRREHLCPKILNCPRLRNLSLSVPSLCEKLFTNSTVNWTGEMQIRTSTVCGRHPLSLKFTPEAQYQFWSVLEQARWLMSSRDKDGVELEIEVFVGDLIFEPRRSLVHGNFDMAAVLSNEAWPPQKMPSSKGPYGQTGLYGKTDGPYECVSERVFREGLDRSYISF